jgi:UDP:flavonoid glycosyltransferase YjiC (YdhE family)
MVTTDYEIIFLGDFREPCFRHRTIADQLKALCLAGYSMGLMQLSGDRTSRSIRIHDDINALIKKGVLAQLDPDQLHKAKLVIATDPALFDEKPRRSVRLEAQERLILVSEGPMSVYGRKLFDWTKVKVNAGDILGQNVVLAPSDPAIRALLERTVPEAPLSNIDWLPAIDPADWRVERHGFCSTRPVLGQSGPSSASAWSDNADDILSLFPEDPGVLVRILNGGAILGNQVSPLPRNWEVVTSSTVSERNFLSTIDFFIYGHHSDRYSPVDASLLRAMASGAVAILSPAFEAIFGHAAVYSEPHDVKSHVQRLYNDPASYRSVSQAGIEIVKQQFSDQALKSRVLGLIGNPKAPGANGIDQRDTQRFAAPKVSRRAMFVTINGVGMGHLTRMLAIAKRCPSNIEPVFVTMSQGLKVIREQGYLAEFIPSRQYLNCDIGQWNRFLRDELNEMISFYDPAVVVFDGNVPYQGLVEAIKDNPDPWFIWSRRGMWRARSQHIIDREENFDVVIEPGDLAGADDHGITTHHRERTFDVAPVRLLDNEQLLSREAARAELGLDPEKTVLLIQLGSRNNFDFQSIHNAALAHISDRQDVQVAFGEWLISDKPVDLPDAVVRMPGYPFARYFNAFDAAISAVGYNSFHELLFAGIPTILVPNEATEQDNQIARSLYADRHGLAICVRTKDVYRLTAAIDRLLNPDERERIRSKLLDLDQTNGAVQAATLINEMAYSRRIDGA